MKEIKAYTKSIKCEEITHALHAINKLQGASFSEVRGFGRGKSESSGYVPRRRPSGICATRIGLRGDGRIFVSDIERDVGIRNLLG